MRVLEYHSLISLMVVAFLIYGIFLALTRNSASLIAGNESDRSCKTLLIRCFFELRRGRVGAAIMGSGDML